MFFCFAQRHEVHKGFFGHFTFFVSLVPLCETRFSCGYAVIGGVGTCPASLTPKFKGDIKRPAIVDIDDLGVDFFR